jgi:sensor histidine kinase regulating citrate/malate metabolism
MPNMLKKNGLPLWRKIIIIPLLPAIIMLWMVGWTLTQIGSQKTTTQINQRTLHHQHEEPKMLDNEEQEIFHEQEILA